MSTLARRRRGIDFWPGFVDALSSLLMVLVFMLLIFTIGQFVLSDALSGRDKALAQLNAELAQLAKTLSMEQDARAAATARAEELAASLSQAGDERDGLRLSLDATQAALTRRRRRARKIRRPSHASLPTLQRWPNSSVSSNPRSPRVWPNWRASAKSSRCRPSSRHGPPRRSNC